MGKARNHTSKTPAVAAEEALRRHKIMDDAIANFRGSADELEGALGMYMIGRHVGWKVLHIVHSKRTIAKYEAILGIVVRDEFPAETVDSDRSLGYRVISEFSNFWKAASGDHETGLDRAGRRQLE